MKNDQLPHSRLSWALMIIALVLSFVFVILGAGSDTPDGNLAGRGGALAVAISFGILFTRETSTENIFQALAAMRAKLLKRSPLHLGDEADPMVDAILKTLGDRSAAQTRQNIALAIVGVIGTLAWGFGDIPAVALYPCFHGGKPYKQSANVSH
jgi:hypothetical protein